MPEINNYLDQLVIVLRGFAFVSMVLALLHAVHDFRSGQNVTKYIVYLLCLTAFLAFYSDILDFGGKMFDQGVNEARQQTFRIWDELDAGISENSRSGGIMVKYILVPLNKGLLTCCRLFHWFSSIVMAMFKVIYRVSAPLALGMAAWRVFIPTGVRFAAGTLWLCTWSVGCAITDIILLKILGAVLAKSLLTGTSGVAGAVAAKMILTGGKIVISPAVLWALLFGFIIFLVTAFTLYILIPIALYHIICAGDAVQGATHAMSGAIGGGMAMNNDIGKTFAARGNGGGSGGGGGGNPPAALASNSGNAGSNASSGNTGTGNSQSNRSHAALAEAAERQLEKRNA